MNTRCFLMLLCVAPLLLAAGCAAAPDAPADGASPSAGETPKVEENSNPNVAPEPHAPGEGAQFAPVARPWTDRPSKKPWPELIVGKWMRTSPEFVGQKVWEFTKDGKLNTCYSYPASSNEQLPPNPAVNIRPAGNERDTRDYRVSGNVLFPTSTREVARNSTESTTFIKSLTENELVIYTDSRVRWTLEAAKDQVAGTDVPLEVMQAKVLREERYERGIYVRLKDKDK